MKKRIQRNSAFDGQAGPVEEQRPLQENDCTGLELLLARTSASLEKANRLLMEKNAENIRLKNQCQIFIDRYQNLISNIPGVVYRCANDESWTMEFISDQIEELTGFPASDFIGNAVRSYSSVIHPADRMDVFDEVQKGVTHHQPYELQYRVRHTDGSIRWVYEKGQGIFSHDNELLYLDGVIFDFSDRLQLEGFRRR